MRVAPNPRQVWVLVLLAAAALASAGCSRAKYRLQADSEAYGVIAERNADPRWSAANPAIELDPRSRYFDPYDPDCPPMPPDDPAAHRYMRLVDGKQGWKHWHDNGFRPEVENPAWREALSEYVAIDEDGSIKLDVDSALALAYIHSPDHQDQLETLYLSALDVTAERFRLDTQFFGGYDARYVHNGSLIPPALRFDPTLGRFIINPALDGPGIENNRLTLGRPLGADPALLAQRRFATAGELLAGFANSFVFEFTGADANLSASLANFSFIQPLLRGAGRDVALEQLTFFERTLLANLRAYSQFRQGFYTQVAIGELGVTGPRRGGRGTNLESFSGQGGFGGYIGLLQQLQQIRNTEDNLDLQLRTLKRLEAFLQVGVIELVQVEQFRQNVENERANLLQSRVSYELSLDRFKANTLGLPPDLPIELDDSMIQQFQLVAPEAIAIQAALVALQQRVARLPDIAQANEIEPMISDAVALVTPIREQLGEVRADLIRLDDMAAAREQEMTAEQRVVFQNDRDELRQTLADLEIEFDQGSAKLATLAGGPTQQTRAQARRNLITQVGEILRFVERVVLVQARARLEMVTVQPIELESREAYNIALGSRLDFMNGRASLVDSWRMVQVNGDALQAVLNVTGSGDVRTARNNPVSFRAPTGNVRLGLEVDAPYTRLLERNAYRESLIEYQRSRRGYIQSRDSLHLGLRALLRQLDQLQENLEIQRRAVAISIRRVDLTQADLSAPGQATRPGQVRAAQFNPTTAINLLSAQTSLRDTQNNFLNVWLNYYATRMRLSRELGSMRLDLEGRWIDVPISTSDDTTPPNDDNTGQEELPVPPAVPTEWIELAHQPGSPANGPNVMVNPVGPVDDKRAPWRLPATETPDTNGYDPPPVGARPPGQTLLE